MATRVSIQYISYQLIGCKSVMVVLQSSFCLQGICRDYLQIKYLWIVHQILFYLSDPIRLRCQWELCSWWVPPVANCVLYLIFLINWLDMNLNFSFATGQYLPAMFSCERRVRVSARERWFMDKIQWTSWADLLFVYAKSKLILGSMARIQVDISKNQSEIASKTLIYRLMSLTSNRVEVHEYVTFPRWEHSRMSL